MKEYLTKKFDFGEKKRQKVDPEQVAKDMRNSRNLENQRIFGREDWLTKAQVQGFFSRLASARRKRGYSDATNQEEKDEDYRPGEEDEQRQAVEEVMEDLGLKHPIVFDIYNVCQYFHSNKLSSFNVNMLRDNLCRYFQIPFKQRDVKKELIAKISGLVKECQCNKK